MEVFDMLLIVVIIVASLGTLSFVYWFMFLKNDGSVDEYEDMKNNVYNLVYNIKKNILEVLEAEETLPERYVKVLEEITDKYGNNCDLVHNIRDKNEDVKKSELNKLIKENKLILKHLLSFEKATLSGQMFSPLIYDKYIEKLEKYI